MTTCGIRSGCSASIQHARIADKAWVMRRPCLQTQQETNQSCDIARLIGRFAAIRRWKFNVMRPKKATDEKPRAIADAEVAAAVGIFVVVVAVLSAVLTALYAFQQDDWRTLLAFSSAGKCGDRRRHAWCCFDLPRSRKAGPRRPGLDGIAAALRRTFAHFLSDSCSFPAASQVRKMR